MVQRYLLLLSLVSASCFLDSVSSRPSNNEYPEQEEGRTYLEEPHSMDSYYYDGMEISKKPNAGVKFILRVSPQALAVSGAKGSAIANPISYVFIKGGEKSSIIHDPAATAVAGPGGIAHALSELNVYEYNSDYDSTQYLPFYGGAKGQYLEIRKDTRGSILSERIVPEDSISNENIFKATEGNLQAKMFQANLAQLKSLSSSVLRLYNLGRRLGYLGEREKERFETQLASLEETASNTVKIVDEIGDDVDVLFKKSKPESTTTSTTAAAEHSSSVPALRKYQDNYDDDDDVGEEGISVGAQADDSNENYEVHERRTISEAKPIGLAVVGENGVAASRPIGTAVAASGVAIARPIATAIAGLDPTLLGIDFQLNHYQKTFKINKKT